MILEMKNVSLSYDGRAVLSSFNLRLLEGQHMALMGPSGIGKTTVAKLALGLIKPNVGEVICSAKRISASFQEPRLIPHLSALQNVSLVLDDGDADAGAMKYLRMTGLSAEADKLPWELSGGMSRRVSLARSLAYGGDLFILDEPYANLDMDTAMEMLEITKKETEHSACLLITHSREIAESFTEVIIYM